MNNNSRMVIRRAERQDGPALLGLIDSLADYEKLPRPDAEAKQRLLHDAFVQKRFDVLFVDWDERTVGYAVLLETYSTFIARPTLFLEDLFVLPEFRGRHVGYALFRSCVQEADRRQCGRMEWLVLDWNKPALGFYDHAGANQLKGWVPFRLNREKIQAIARDPEPLLRRY